ncbi:PAS domain S-box protein [Marinobacter sp.]|uniref:PAS domain-containing sensor histidine kinase n=1 Tax=Marinobacter sp. TaxID=50741 RepID=UPI00384F6E96
MSRMDVMPGAVIRLDTAGYITDLSRNAEHIDAPLKVRKCFPEMLDRKAADWLHAALAGKQDPTSRELEATIGSQRFRLTIGSEPDPDGGYLLQLPDITEYRALSQTLAWNEQRYRSLFSENPDAVFSLDPEGRFLEINQATLDLTGYSRPELIVCNWEDFVNPADRERARVSFGAALVGNPSSFRCRMINREDRTVIAQVTHFPIVVEDELVGVFGVARDKTQRYQLEQSRRLLRTCVDQIHEVIMITEMEPGEQTGPRIEFVNQAVKRIAGYSPDELIGQSPCVFQGNATQSPALDRIREARRNRQAITEELLSYRSDGTPFWNEMEVVPVPSAHEGESGHFVWVLRDITQAKQREAELHRSREELRRLSQAQDSMLENERKRIARDLHDELGQSLTALKLQLAVALNQSSELPESHVQRLRLLVETTEGMIDRVRETAANLRPAMLDDLGFEAAAEWFLDRCASGDGLDVHWLAQLETHSSRVTGDTATALFRILQECMTNVVRHARASSVEVWYEESADTARLIVVDDGVGFDPGSVDSRGLGLVGIRERVALLDGDLLLESALGKGVRLVVTLALTGESSD